MPKIAKTFEEVGKKPIDFQSFNHIIMGYISYLLCFFIISFFFNFEIIVVWGWSCFIGLFSGVMWEIIENIGFPNAFFRIWGLDSLENSLMDIFFDAIGVMIGFTLSWFNWEVILVVGFVMMVILIFAMYVLMKLTQPKDTNERE